MAGPKVTIKESNPDWIKEEEARMANFKDIEVAVGFPANDSEIQQPHYDGGASIIDVALNNNYGTDRTPRRDFMTKPTKEMENFFDDFSARTYHDVWSGKIKVEKALDTVGQKGVALIKNSIVELRSPANSEATVKAKKSDNPLVDTMDMANATTYVVRKKRKQ